MRFSEPGGNVAVAIVASRAPGHCAWVVRHRCAMKHQISYLVILLAAMLVSCSQHSPVSSVSDILGFSQPEVFTKYGSPKSQHDFLLSHGLNEMTGPLRHHFPKSEWSQTMIRELTWEFRDDYMTLWLYQTNGVWRVVDGLRYKKGIVF